MPQSWAERGMSMDNLTNVTTSAPYSYRISSGFVCNSATAGQPSSGSCGSGTCMPVVQNGVTITQNGMANITLNEADTSAAFSLIGSTANIPFPTSASTSSDAQGYRSCVSPSWAGYLSFTPMVNCVIGIVSDCGGSVEENTPVKMCAPMSNGDQLAGAVYFKQTSAETAGGLGTVPSPTQPEEEPFVGGYRNPTPIPASEAATMVPGQRR